MSEKVKIDPRTNRVPVGAVVPARELATIDGDPVAVPDRRLLVHLQFRRFAGCPICHLHLRSVVRRHDEIVAAGVREVVLFRSSADELRPYAADLPLPVVADPDRSLYAEFAVEAAPRALADPRVWVPILRAVGHSLWSIIRHGRPVPPINPASGRFGLPADFLVSPDGRVLAAHYGEHADDQWPVDEVIRLAREHRGTEQS